MKNLIKITKEESQMFRKEVPSAHIAIVNRHHRNKGYYIEESKPVMAILSKTRGWDKPRKKWK